MKPFMSVAAGLLATCCLVRGLAAAEACAQPEQIPLCMIGDSITWAMEGDHWRRQLVELLPRVAFVGTHSARWGYSHAGEGGNSTAKVLERLDQVPASPYYHLLIGTNDNGVAQEAEVQPRAEATAGRIATIVERLLARPDTRLVFLGSLLPCTADAPNDPGNPLRARTNAATNVVLRGWLGGRLPAGRVVWIDYERDVLATPGWERSIRLHPTAEGYRVLSTRLAETLAATFALAPAARALVPQAQPGAGVAVDNLLDDAGAATRAPVIAGWYTLSYRVVEAGPGAAVVLAGTGKDFPRRFPAEAAAGRCEHEVFTGYEGYGYERGVLRLSAEGCRIEQAQFEKRRPAGRASQPGRGSFLDTVTPPAPGELLVRAP